MATLWPESQLGRYNTAMMTGKLGAWEHGDLRAEAERVDVLIITAVGIEYDAVLQVDEGALPSSRWEVRRGSIGMDVSFREFHAADGGVLRVAVTRALEMGSVATVVSASSLVKDYRPKCLAMSGVCAGWRAKVGLGDVIIADRLWAYDTGKVEAEVDGRGQRHERVKSDTSTYQLYPSWKQRAEAFVPAEGSAWLTTRPRPYTLQMEWVLERLVKGEDPRSHPDRQQACSDYAEVMQRLWRKGWVEDGTQSLSEEGRRHIERRLLLYPDGLPNLEPFRVHVGAIATGSRVTQDPTIFERLSQSVRTVLGMEMEGSAIGAIAHQMHIPYALVMKGVMDFADEEKSDHFKAFAARASAECLLAFVRAHLPTGRGLIEAAPEEDFHDLLDPGLSKPPTRLSPAALLNARYRFMPFFEQGRTELLRELRDWCDDAEPVSARLIHGAGGMGKTRLFIEWAERLRGEGWRAGFLVRSADPTRFEALVSSAHSTLVVIDYAESRSKLDALLQLVARQRNAGRKGRLRVVLLARTAGEWFHELQAGDGLIRDLLADHPPTQLSALSAQGSERKEVFQRALQHFARQRGCTPPQFPPPALEDSRFERILYVHMAALAAFEGLPFTAESLMEDVLDHEERFWLAHVQSVLPTEKDRRLFKERTRRMVAALTLRGGAVSRPEAEELLARACGTEDELLLLLLQDLYPGGGQDGEPVQFGGLEPDLLGDAMVWRVLVREAADAGAWLENVLQGARERAMRVAFELLGRLSVEHAEQAGRWIRGLLARDIEGRAVAALEAAKALGQHTAYATLGKLLGEALERQGSIALALRIDQAGVPSRTISLCEVACWTLATLLRHLPRQDAPEPSFLRALVLMLLADRQHDQGQKEAALDSFQQAVTLLRKLASDDPELLPMLAVSLLGLGQSLSRLGQSGAALAAIEESWAILSQCAELGAGIPLSTLGLRLATLGATLCDLGRWSEALEVLESAVAIHRTLVETQPNSRAVLSQLAQSLRTMRGAQVRVGNIASALASSEEEVGIYRALARVHPDEFQPEFALGLINLCTVQKEMDQHEAALLSAQEAVGVFRRLAETRPEVFLVELAGSLCNLNACQADEGNYEAALKTIQEAVTLFRKLAAVGSNQSQVGLATSLMNLGIEQARTGHPKDGVPALHEAVTIYRALVARAPVQFLPDLALGLRNLGMALHGSEQNTAALPHVRESVKLLRELAKTYPNKFNPSLAASLNSLAQVELAGGSPSRALRRVREAVDIYREMSALQPGRFGPELSGGLFNRSNALAKLGLWPEALASVDEALDVLWPLFLEQPAHHKQQVVNAIYKVMECLQALNRQPSVEFLGRVAVLIDFHKAKP